MQLAAVICEAHSWSENGYSPTSKPGQFYPQERTFHNRSRGEKPMKEMHHLAMATEQPLRDGSSPEEYDQLFELLKEARALVAAAT